MQVCAFSRLFIGSYVSRSVTYRHISEGSDLTVLSYSFEIVSFNRVKEEPVSFLKFLLCLFLVGVIVEVCARFCLFF